MRFQFSFNYSWISTKI